MENIIETIRAATNATATDEERAAAVHACRALLATLEPNAPAATPTTATAPSAVPEGATAAAVVQSIAIALRGMTPDQLLDLAIAKLRAVVPVGTESTPAKGVTFSIVPVQHLSPPGATP